MFKAKLQEGCQQRNLGLPRYSCVKDGLEHSPRFRASVFVDGISYNSPVISKSSNEALDHAAKLAFFRLTTSVEPGPEVPESDKAYTRSHSNPSSSDIKVGKHQQHKLQLQQFAQSKNLDPPLYSYKREGPPHALQFQVTVTIGGQSFESSGYYRNLKEANHAAAKVALLSLDVLQEIDTYCYKNMLQDLTQNGGLNLPGYKTVTRGPPHQRTFFSNVEIKGEVIYGDERKSKKLAELSAAKAAYLLLMKGKLTDDLDLTSSSSSSQVPTKSPPCSGSLTNLNSPKISKVASSVGFSPAEESVEYANENEDEVDEFLMKSPVSSKASSMCSSQKEGQSYAATVAPPDLSSLKITSLKTKKKAEMGNYLLCNKVRVYTSIPSTKFPEGTVLLPIDDHKWVAVSLEFPNQKIN